MVVLWCKSSRRSGAGEKDRKGRPKLIGHLNFSLCRKWHRAVEKEREIIFVHSMEECLVKWIHIQ